MTRDLPLIFLALVALGGCASRNARSPVTATMQHYEIPWPNAFPSDVAIDAQGRLWFTDRLTHGLGVFDPESETFERIETPTANSAPYGLLRAPDGVLWFGESNAGRLGRVDPGTRRLGEVDVPGLERGPNLLVWADGVIWFTARAEDAFGWYDPATGESEVWKGRIEEPYGIGEAGGTIWVGGHGGSHLYRIDGAASGIDSIPRLDLGEVVRIPLSEEVRRRVGPERAERLATRRRAADVRRIASDGERLWVAEYGRGRVTGVDPRTGDRIHIETLAQPSRPYGLAVDGRGRVWFSERGNGALVMYDPRGRTRRVFELPVSGGTIRHIAIDDARGRVWLPLSDIGVIGLLRLGR